MKKVLKKIPAYTFLLVMCLTFVIIANAISYDVVDTIAYDEYVRVSKSSMGESFATTIYALSKTGTPVIETKVGRKMFNLVWHDSGTVNRTISTLNYPYTYYWSANGTYDTRSTWTNTTSGTSLYAKFALY